MELVNQFIFIGALLILLSILAGMVSSRLGAPFLLVFWPAFSLATVGVLLSAFAIAGLAHLFMGLSPLEGVLLGSVLASTDAAAVFMLLHGRGQAVNARVAGTLELESGMNDPMAVFL